MTTRLTVGDVTFESTPGTDEMIVGSSAQWSDASDATYAVLYQDETAISAQAPIPTLADVGIDSANVTSARMFLRVSSVTPGQFAPYLFASDLVTSMYPDTAQIVGDSFYFADPTYPSPGDIINVDYPITDLDSLISVLTRSADPVLKVAASEAHTNVTVYEAWVELVADSPSAATVGRGWRRPLVQYPRVL